VLLTRVRPATSIRNAVQSAGSALHKEAKKRRDLQSVPSCVYHSFVMMVPISMWFNDADIIVY